MTISTRLNMRRRTPPQKRISESLTRFNVAAWGRQSGKTTFGLDKMIIKPLMGRPGGVYWYVLQTYAAAEVAFNRYLALLSKTDLITYKNRADKVAVLDNGASVFFKSGKNYQDLRAETLDGAIIDEMRQQHKDLWPMVIRPMLARRGGWCDFYSTPNGFDHFYDLAQLARNNPKEWSFYHAPSTEAPWWTESEVQSARATMSEDEFAQEILAEFRSIGFGKAYLSHGPHNQVSENPFAVRGLKWSPYLPIIVGLDFNVGHMSWVLGQSKGEDIYFGEEIVVKGTNTDETTQVLVNRVKGHRLGVLLVGDATGKSNKTSASGATDYSIITKALREANIPFRNLTPESNPPVKDRINTMNAMLKSASGGVHFFYNPAACPKLARDLDRVTWKQGTDSAILDKSDPDLTHSSDAAGYPVFHFFNMSSSRPGLLRVIER